MGKDFQIVSFHEKQLCRPYQCGAHLGGTVLFQAVQKTLQNNILLRTTPTPPRRLWAVFLEHDQR